MAQAAVKSLSFSEFIETTPDNGKRYELVNGQVVEMVPTRAHDNVADFIYDVEVTSTNWRDGYLYELAEYEALGIFEYWIVDYLALGAARYIGSPKVPTISIYQLVGGEYQLRQFREGDAIASPTFLDLQITAQEIFNAIDD